MRDHQPLVTVPAAAACGKTASTDASARRQLSKACIDGRTNGNDGVWPTAEE